MAKTIEEKEKEIVQFIKDAFCIDGYVKIVHEPAEYPCFIMCKDSARGIMHISISNHQEKQ